MVDETKPPETWCVEQQGEDCWVGVKLNGATDYCTTEEAATSEAHRIAREEAAPYLSEALERIAAWLEEDSFRMRAEEIRKMARGERPLPGSEGR